MAVAAHWPTGAGTGAGLAAPILEARYEPRAVLDRCHVDVEGAGTQPVALDSWRPGDIVVALHGLSCPVPPRESVISARH